MKRRQRLAAHDRKRQILQGALRVFARKGYEGATSRELAEAAGVSEALIYKYFPTKEALYTNLVSLLEGNKNRLVDLWTRPAPGTASLIFTLHGLSRMIVMGPPGRPKDDSFDRLLGQSLLGDGAFAEAFFQSLFFPLLPYLLRGLEEAQRTGDLEHTEPPQTLPCVLFHHFMGAVALFRLPPRSMFPTNDLVELHRQALLFGLRGIGLTESAIARHADFARLDHEFESHLLNGDQT